MPSLSARLIPAMITPFNADESIDYSKLQALAKHLAQHGCDGLLVNGTTAECPTLTGEEKIKLVQTVQSAVSGLKTKGGNPVQIVAGIGSNNTKTTIEEAQRTAALGVDALLVVVPYYNKPSQRGMIEHFTQVAESVETEIVIYNIPSRTMVLMEPDTMATLHQRCPNIIGVKQSHPDMDAVSEITHKLPAETWRTWSGDDSLTLPMMACGAYGAFSVLGHLTGDMLYDMITAMAAGNHQRALALHLEQLNLGREIFCLPNPTVIKTCMAELGFAGPTFRAPMVSPTDEEMVRIRAIFNESQAVLNKYHSAKIVV
ncbi:MAG: 4-hydroxy-tetrahydrodipicolinate synthase [Cyanobacteria bacterium P01_H01_bin.74]